MAVEKQGDATREASWFWNVFSKPSIVIAVVEIFEPPNC